MAVANITPEALSALRASLDKLGQAKLAVKSAEWGLGVIAAPKAEEAVDHTITLSVIKDILKFDKTELSAPAGKKIKLVFSNPDHMMHNWLLLKPGTTEAVGALADKMMTDPGAMAADYIPVSKDILAHSKLLMPGTTESIVFTAPTQPGDYPYVCTFPGHWRIMRGILKVK
jgi:azurin